MNMNAVRWDPFKEIDRMFGVAANDWQPLVDIREGDDAYSVELDLPAVAPRDVRIELKDGLLHVSGERAVETNDERVRLRERRYGKFARSFRLPEDADADAITATAKNGVVRIAIGKSAVAQARAIEVQAA